MGARISLLQAMEKGKDISVPLGKLTTFGYSTNFDAKYQKGKLLGHGQYSYTYVAAALATGDKAAVKILDKNKAFAKDKTWMLKESNVSEILQAMDSTRDGLVDFEEFVAATLHVQQLEEHDTEKWNRQTQAAFNKFDSDKDGYITAEELRVYTGMKGSIAHLLDEADTDMDGKINLREFRKLLQVGMNI